MRNADVLIIGAGIAGASMAYELAPLARVILLEREGQPGYHATGRSAAVFSPSDGNRVIHALTSASRGFYEARAGGLAPQPVLAPRGELIVGREDQLTALDAYHAAGRAEALHRLDRREACQRVPILRADYVAGAIHDPGTMDLDVAAIHQGYLRAFAAAAASWSPMPASRRSPPTGRHGGSRPAPARLRRRCWSMPQVPGPTSWRPWQAPRGSA